MMTVLGVSLDMKLQVRTAEGNKQIPTRLFIPGVLKLFWSAAHYFAIRNIAAHP